MQFIFIALTAANILENAINAFADTIFKLRVAYCTRPFLLAVGGGNFKLQVVRRPVSNGRIERLF